MLDFDTETGTITLFLAGKYDISGRQRILDALASVLRLPGVARVVLDMEGVTFLDSTTIGAMVAARLICLSQSKPLMISRPSRPVVRLLRLTRTDVLFPFPGPAPAGARA